jgi:pyruvate/2-oxoglutarate dehydrogenase complex dihydrolipoamide dehydrogenase (E3) component
VTAIDPQRIKIECSNGETFEANALLLALGRSGNPERLGLESAGPVPERMAGWPI